MQARFATFSAIAALMAFATPAMAQEITLAELQARGACPELPVCGNCSADTKATENTAPAAGGDGGIWRSTNGAAAQPATPGDVQTAPQANMPIFLELDGVPGEGSEAPSSPPPPPPPPPPPRSGSSMPSEQFSLNFEEVKGATEAGERDVAAPQAEQAGLLLPAIQRVRGAAAASENAPPTGETGVMPEMPICAYCGADAQAEPSVQAPTEGAQGMLLPAIQQVRPAAERVPPSAASSNGGTLTLSGNGQAVMPEQPVCDHCGTHVQAPASEQAASLPTGRRQHIPVRPVREAAATTEASATEATAEVEQPQRPRRRFSLSIGGVTLSSDGGVSVAVGDVTGDGSGETSQPGSDRTAPSARPARRSSAPPARRGN